MIKKSISFKNICKIIIVILLLPAFVFPINAFSLGRGDIIGTYAANRNTNVSKGNTITIIIATVITIPLIIGIWYWTRGGVDKTVNNAEKQVNKLKNNQQIDERTKEDVLKTINKAEEKIKSNNKIDNIKRESLQKRMEEIKNSYNKICKSNILINYDGGTWDKINLNNNKPQKRRK